jgi:hypothetical protein
MFKYLKKWKDRGYLKKIKDKTEQQIAATAYEATERFLSENLYFKEGYEEIIYDILYKISLKAPVLDPMYILFNFDSLIRGLEEQMTVVEPNELHLTEDDNGNVLLQKNHPIIDKFCNEQISLIESMGFKLKLQV